MKVNRIIKSVVLASAVILSMLFAGCSRAYIERTDRWIKNYREQEVRPGRLKFYSNECRRPIPLFRDRMFMGGPNFDIGHISIDPGSINVPASSAK